MKQFPNKTDVDRILDEGREKAKLSVYVLLLAQYVNLIDLVPSQVDKRGELEILCHDKILRDWAYILKGYPPGLSLPAHQRGSP